MSTPSVFIMGPGCVFSISTDGTTFTPVNQIQQVTYSGGKQNFDDITNLSSPGGVTEVAPTTKDSGTCQLTGVFSDADAGQLLFQSSYNETNPTTLSVKMQMAPHGSQTKGFLRTFNAYVEQPLNLSFGTTKAISFSASLRLTGLITDTAGS